MRRVITASGAVTETHYVGQHYEKTVGSGDTKYYFIAGQLVAFERSSGYGVDWGRRFVFRDQLGSTNVIINGSSGVLLWRDRYLPFGDVRDTYRKDNNPSFSLQTQYRFTGQRLESRLGTPENGLDRGLYFYGSRWYDSSLGRFISPDTIVQSAARNARPVLPLIVSYANPRILQQWNQFQRAGRQSGAQAAAPFDPQLLNRFSYVRNNPLAYTDDSGNIIWWIVGGIAGGVVGFGAYALTHQDNFDWGQAALWTGGGALVGATFGAGAQLVAGALTAEAAAAATAGTTAATAACADGNCLNEVQATQKIIETGWTVIGKYPAYLDKARQLGASALNVSMGEWNALGSRAAQWARNVQFLDEAITRGDSFRLATSFAQGWAEKGTFYKQELIYLLQKGYELITDINGAEWLIKTK